MKSQFRPSQLHVGVCLGLILVGCRGGAGPTYPPTIPVTGVVTLNGEPVAGATVILVSGDAKGFGASGTTDESGKFFVKTFFDATHEAKGAVEGDYQITVTKIEAAAAPEIPKTMEEQASKSNQMMKMQPPKSLLPTAYGKPSSSGLKVTVEAGLEPLQLELKE